MALLLIIFISTIFLLFLILGSKDNTQPKTESAKPWPKEIKTSPVADEAETLRAKLRKLKEDNLALVEELKTAKNNEVLAREEAIKIKGWLEKDRSLEESLKKELYELKEKLLKKDKEFDQEFSLSLILKKELSEYKEKRQSLEAEARENSEKLRILEAQNANLKEELKDRTRNLAEFKKEKQESQWVSKKEYDELKAKLNQRSDEAKEQG
ncbi:MAG: hypothetical protein AABZ65_07415 [Candidatus Omnitrophota bacterium]